MFSGLQRHLASVLSHPTLALLTVMQPVAQTELPELDWAETRLAATTATIATFIVVEYVRARCDINKGMRWKRQSLV